jgi:hypothetical protein
MDIKEKNIEKYYKDIDKPIVNNYMNNFNLKNLLNLTTIIDLSAFTNKNRNKKKKEWQLKDKRKLLKECEIKKKEKIKEATSTLTSLVTNKSKKVIDDVKNKNETILNEIENIDTLIETIEKDYPDNNSFLETFSN